MTRYSTAEIFLELRQRFSRLCRRPQKPPKLNQLRRVRLFFPKPVEVSPPVFTLQPQRMHRSSVLRWPLRGCVFRRETGLYRLAVVAVFCIFAPVFRSSSGVKDAVLRLQRLFKAVGFTAVTNEEANCKNLL